jgi:diacylglycerol O-acyltransferase / wax synthase
MRALSPSDQLFLLLERRQQPMHVAGLQLFSFPEGASDDYVMELAEWLRSFKSPSRPFNQHLVTRFGRQYWDEDTQFDLDHHFRHEALPHPGRIRELLSLVSAEHSNLLHRERPLWEAHLVEGLTNRRFAMYTKIHHSVMDGISAMRLCQRSLSTDSTERNMPPPWAMPARKRDSAPVVEEQQRDLVGRLTAMLGKQLSTLPAVVREMVKLSQRSQRDPDYVSLFKAPHCILSERITGSRRFAAQSYSLSRVKNIARAYDITVNDTVLAICSGALRSYLISHDSLPDIPLVAMVPMSLRRDDSTGGNQIAMILANLATHLDDAAQRVRVINASVRESKLRYAQMSAEESINFTALTMAPSFFSILTGLAPQLLAFNVVISNVPGPREPLYWNGARLVGMYPVSIVIDRMALNITITSFDDSLEFGLIACRRTLPSMQRLLDYIERSIHDLEEAAGIKG